MGLFKRSQASEPDQNTTEIEQLLVELRVRMQEVESQLNGLEHIEVEWADWFEKYKNLYARLNRRVEREESKNGEDEPAPINPAAARLLGTRHGG